MYLHENLTELFLRYEQMGHHFLSDKKDEKTCFITVNNPNDWPRENSHIDSYYEPMVRGNVIVPQDYLTQTTSLCNNSRGIQTLGPLNYTCTKLSHQ